MTKSRRIDPPSNRLPRLLGDFELDQPPSFLLDHNGSGLDTAAHRYVVDLYSSETASPQFTVDCEIEHRKITYPFLQLKSNTDGKYPLDFEWWLLPSKPASAPSHGEWFDFSMDRLLGHNASVDCGQVTSRPEGI